MKWSALSSSLLPVALGLLVSACEDDHAHDHDHVHAKRLYPSTTLTPPSSPLVWADFNIIHTTDSHGWLLGHQKTSFPEPNYSGDFGDFASFVAHMKQIALEKDVDLLLVDSGDLHDGTGLSDGFPPGGVDAHESNKFFAQLPYDLLAIGNHELYIYNNTLDMYNNFVPKFPGRYLSSNVNITVEIDGKWQSVPVGSRYAKFTTRKGRRITSLGVLYDFTGNDVNTTVQKVEDMVNETWFAEAIAEEPDLFVLVGHMPVREDKWPYVFNAVRAVHPTTPILILGGHTHIRDCLQLDGRSISLESGRYMETVGWLSADLSNIATNKNGNITFTRRYLDPNRVTYEYHTGVSNRTYDTPLGKEITQGLLNLWNQFDLSYFYGTAPQDYFLSRAPYPSNSSSLSLFIEDAVPTALKINNTRASVPAVMITNSGSQRFDLYGGTFTKNDQLTVSPFDDTFLYIPSVTASVAQQVLPALNNAGADERRRSLIARAMGRSEEELYGRGYVDNVYRRWLREMDERQGAVEKRAAANLTLGYVTTDNCAGVGDDTLHAPLPYYDTPDFIGSNFPDVADDSAVDLVFVDFIESQLLGILNGLQSDKTYTDSDVLVYSPLTANEVLGVYAQATWN